MPAGSVYVVLGIILAIFVLRFLFPTRPRLVTLNEHGAAKSSPASSDDGQGDFRAVSIHAYGGRCLASQSVSGQRFLTSEAPTLPLEECTAEKCNCRYVHHADRRRGTRDRRTLSGLLEESPVFSMGGHDRRITTGRRTKDWVLS
jgi:hypothetical protein